MNEALATEQVAEEYRIRRVRELWAFGRDRAEWETVKSCFHPEGAIHVSWYSGSASGFIERSRQMVGNRRPEERNKHWLGNMRAAVRGPRAVLECDVLILVREFIDDILFDYTSYARFYDLFEKRDDVWRILKMTCIYDKDRLDPVVPGSVPKSFYDAAPVLGRENGFAFMRWRQGKKGRTVPTDIVMGDSEDEARLRSEGDRWLSGA
jgi:hypothetical protein